MTRWNPSLGLDDNGDNLSGEPVNRAYLEGIIAACNALIHSESYPTVSPKDIIEQVRAAAGNLTDVNTRLGKVVDADGIPIVGSGVLSTTVFTGSMGLENYARNPSLDIWANGDTDEPPTSYVFSGTGASCVRCGTGEADTNKWIGDKCAKLTDAGSGDTYLRQYIYDAAAVTKIANALKSRWVTVTARVKTTSSSLARLIINDGAGDSDPSSYHTGAGDWEMLTTSKQLSTGVSDLYWQLQLDKAGDAYVDGITFTFTQNAPTEFLFPAAVRGTLYVPMASVTTGDGKFHYVFQRPTIVESIACYATTAPGGADDFDIDAEKRENGGGTPAWVSLYTAPQTILTAAEDSNEKAIDGDWDHRCFKGGFGTDFLDALFRLNVDTAGGSIAGANLMIRCLQPIPPNEYFMAYNDQ